MAQLLSNLPIGSKVKFGKHQVGSETPWDIAWLIVAKNHVGYPTNSVTLLAEKCLDALSFDVREPKNTEVYRQQEGNSRYSVSNIDQWLNSPNQNWYVSRHAADTPPSTEYLPSYNKTSPYDTRNGFLYRFAGKEQTAILNTTIQVALHSVDGGGYEDITRKIFIPSVSEILPYSENGIAEGTQWEWFVKNPDLKCSMFEQAHANSTFSGKNALASEIFYWGVRTPALSSSAANVRYITNKGERNMYPAYQVCGIRPALNLSNSLKVSDATDSEGCYTFIWNAAPNEPSAISVPTI
jgi:hypothetical protein